MWHGPLFKQLPNTQRKRLPFPTLTHTQNRNKKKQLKILKPQISIEKIKRREKRKPIGKNRIK